MNTGRLRIVALVTSIMMIAAAITVTAAYVLPKTDQPGSLQLNLSGTWFGAIPFLLTAVLIILAVRGLGSAEVTRSHAFVTLICIVTVVALLPMAIGGLWAGLGLGFGGVELNSPAEVALTVYQFTFLAALLADIVLLIVAIRVSSTKEEPLG